MKPYQESKLLSIITELMSKPVAHPFCQKVEKPEYLQQITNPMELSTVKTKISSHVYMNIQEVMNDMDLIWNNARKFNGEGSIIDIMAQESKWWFNKTMKHFPESNEQDWFHQLYKSVSDFVKDFDNPPREIDPNKKFSAQYVFKELNMESNSLETDRK